MRRPYDMERRGICVPSARRIGHCLGYRLRNSHVKRFADAFEALAVARFAFVARRTWVRSVAEYRRCRLSPEKFPFNDCFQARCATTAVGRSATFKAERERFDRRRSQSTRSGYCAALRSSAAPTATCTCWNRLRYHEGNLMPAGIERNNLRRFDERFYKSSGGFLHRRYACGL